MMIKRSKTSSTLRNLVLERVGSIPKEMVNETLIDFYTAGSVLYVFWIVGEIVF